jgi:hypothetical protein
LLPLLLAALLALGGCRRHGPPAPGDPSSVGYYHQGAPLTVEECRDFAAAFEKAANGRDSARLDALIDWGAIYERAAATVPGPDEARRRFVRRGPARPSLLAREIIEVVGKNGRCKLLRLRTEADQPHALFRLAQTAQTGGLNYYDLTLIRRGGEVRAIDVFVYARGEGLTHSVRRACLLEVAAQAPDGLDDLSKTDREFIRNRARVQEMQDATARGDYRAALQSYDGLPPALKQDKMILAMRLRAAAGLDEDRYVAALADFGKYHPNDVCLDLLSVDYFTLQKRFGAALEALERLDRSVGGDPLLNGQRADIHLGAGDLKKARRFAQKAIEEEPDLQAAYWVLVTVSLKEKKFDETVRLLDTLAGKFALRFGDFTKAAEYADFVKSPQYRQWLQRRKGKDRAKP